MIKEKHIVWGLAILLLLTTVFDVYTALISPVFSIGEANPIFLLFGNAFILLIITVAFTVYVVWKLKKCISLHGIFLFILIALYLSLAHILGGWTNVNAANSYYENPEETVAKLQSATVADKTLFYFGAIFVFTILPIAFALFAFSMTSSLYAQRKERRLLVVNDMRKLSKDMIKLSRKLTEE